MGLCRERPALFRAGAGVEDAVRAAGDVLVVAEVQAGGGLYRDTGLGALGDLGEEAEAGDPGREIHSHLGNAPVIVEGGRRDFFGQPELPGLPLLQFRGVQVYCAQAVLAAALHGDIEVAAAQRELLAAGELRGLTIGTGKITKREMKGVPHHLLDVASPKRKFSADDYVRYARAAIEDISKLGKLPIVAGGTGFYIDALVRRIALPNVPPNTKLRAQLEKKSVKQLFALLRRKDPQRAKNIEPQHKRRIIRALEIAYALGSVPMMEIRSPSFDALWIGIAPPMEVLEKKILARLLARIRGGMVAEAQRLHAGGLSYKRMEELGLEYRSLARLLQGAITRAQMIEELNRAIRKYAKRQITYWKRNKDIRWFKDPRGIPMSKELRNWLKR